MTDSEASDAAKQILQLKQKSSETVHKRKLYRKMNNFNGTGNNILISNFIYSLPLYFIFQITRK